LIIYFIVYKNVSRKQCLLVLETNINKCIVPGMTKTYISNYTFIRKGGFIEKLDPIDILVYPGTFLISYIISVI